ncbi:uncharacterized protein BYT42DRAFT_608940 [Radiomyces spectabilis]|uniref:uncharacterized protein n=1 Tax=Radiomyces spectabilis TaxID=64574 RepID=UPI00221F6736|nr:uncharacterized protein BYT42DRAFT_608940 [Radiomyces spectabilis]KAI8364719.1 hypothetical protein BYT42DRAFT_608940 [Radiomyces spectabilis]
MFHKTVSIELLEPVVYLRDAKDRRSVNLLHGHIKLYLRHPLTVQAITLRFVGSSKTIWPEDDEQYDKHTLVDSVIPIYCAPTVLQKGKTVFPFEILLSNTLSETIECELGRVHYKLQCQVHVKRWFNKILKTQHPVILVRAPNADAPRSFMHTTFIQGSPFLTTIETLHLTPGLSLALSFSFARSAVIHSIVVKLIERQKFRAPSKHTTRLLHHEITLAPNHNLAAEPCSGSENTFRYSYKVPNLVHPSAMHPLIRIRHWVQVTLILNLKDPHGQAFQEELMIETPVSVLLRSIDDYITLPEYKQTSTSVLPVLSKRSPPPSYEGLLSSI